MRCLLETDNVVLWKIDVMAIKNITLSANLLELIWNGTASGSSTFQREKSYSTQYMPRGKTESKMTSS